MKEYLKPIFSVVDKSIDQIYQEFKDMPGSRQFNLFSGENTKVYFNEGKPYKGVYEEGRTTKYFGWVVGGGKSTPYDEYLKNGMYHGSSFIHLGKLAGFDRAIILSVASKAVDWGGNLNIQPLLTPKGWVDVMDNYYIPRQTYSPQSLYLKALIRFSPDSSDSDIYLGLPNSIHTYPLDTISTLKALNILVGEVTHEDPPILPVTIPWPKDHTQSVKWEGFERVYSRGEANIILPRILSTGISTPQKARMEYFHPRLYGEQKHLRQHGRGVGVVKGKVTVEKLPAVKKVYLFERLTHQLIATTMSRPDGSFEFSHIQKGLEYYAVSFDEEAKYNAVISDRLEVQ